VDGLEGAALRDGSTSQSYACSNLAFPATQVASADANTLDDYEEGTWTPVLRGVTSTSGQVYAEQIGIYQKVGNKVSIQLTVGLTTAGTNTGLDIISGLPFTPAGTIASGSIGAYGESINTPIVSITPYIDSGVSHVNFMYRTAASTTNILAGAGDILKDGAKLSLSIQYTTS